MGALEVHADEGARLISLRGEFDLRGEETYLDALARVAMPGLTVMLDVSELTFIDSTGLRGIIGAVRAVGDDGSVIVRGAEDGSVVARTMEVAGLAAFPNLRFLGSDQDE